MKNSKPTYQELEKRLNYHSQTLNDTQELSLIGSWNWNLETNETEWSDMMFNLMGLNPNEFSPTYDLALLHVHEDDKEKYIHTLTEAVNNKSAFSLENKIIKKDGSVISVISRGKCFVDKEGNLIRMIGTVQDITELKKKEEQLQLQEKIIKEHSLLLEQKVKIRTQELLNSETKLLQAKKTAKLGTWDWNLETDEVEWSDQLYENFDLDKNTIATMDLFFQLIHPDDLEYINKHVVESRKFATPQSLKYRIITNKGEVRYMHGISEEMTNEKGEVRKMVGVVQNITELHKSENLKFQVNAMMQGQEMERERIAADLHDSINPLLSIATLNVESLMETINEKERSSKEKLKTILELLKNAVIGIKEISNNLSPAVLKNFGLQKAIEQLCNKVRVSGQIKIDYQAHGSMEKMDKNIELNLYRMAQELLNNIIKHAKATEIELQLIRHTGTIVLMVSDNGIGFDESVEVLKTNGFGFKNINSRVESLNGKINFDSTKDRGTTVTIELPI